MKPDIECGFCTLRWVYERALQEVGDKEAPQLMRRIIGVLASELSPTVNVGSLCNKTMFAVSEYASSDAGYYNEFKRKSNEYAKSFLPRANDYINAGETPQEMFERACYLAAAGNVSPMHGPSGEAYTFVELVDLVEGRNVPVLMGDVYKAVQGASNILYVTDNAGEIGFDSLLIARLKDMGKKVTLVVKEGPFFDDATMKDALFFGLDKLVDNIAVAKGFTVPGESPPQVSQAFDQCDLVVSKGTGSYEGLHGELADKKAVYMLKVKCKPIVRELGMEEGNIIVKVE